MASKEAYMLARDVRESHRLDFQHDFVRAIGNGNLIHPSIPLDNLHAIADVGTGTGVWLNDISASLTALHSSDLKELVGFDVSDHQFPQNARQGIKMVVHDATEVFPEEYNEKFDLVHIRLLSYAIKAHDLEKFVNCVVKIIKPGGYLQWQEFDAIDTWCQPETADARALIEHVVDERIARGLLPCIATPLVKAIQCTSHTLGSGRFDPLTWNTSEMRIMHLESIPTSGHPSPVVLNGKKKLVISTSIQFLSASISRRKDMMENGQAQPLQKEELARNIVDIDRILRLIEAAQPPSTHTWNTMLTWVVARKSLSLEQGIEWMSSKHLS